MPNLSQLRTMYPGLNAYLGSGWGYSPFADESRVAMGKKEIGPESVLLRIRCEPDEQR
jgi:hypothetical protein